MKFLRALITALACVSGSAAVAAAQFIPTVVDDTPHEVRVYRAKSALLGAATLASIVGTSVDRDAPPWVSAAGFLGGTLQIVLGTRDNQIHPVTSAANLFVGGAAVLTSLSALARNGRPESGTTREEGLRLRPLFAFDDRFEPCAGARLSF